MAILEAALVFSNIQLYRIEEINLKPDDYIAENGQNSLESLNGTASIYMVIRVAAIAGMVIYGFYAFITLLQP